MAEKSSSKDENNNNSSSSGSRKNSSTRPGAAQEQVLKCPRCDSQNTKFCYYNNYSLTQPRYFCKTCRRYWTKGGALRNVPIGGGCRKNKKMKSSSRISGVGDNSRDSSTSSDHNIGGLKFFHGLTPAMDYQLGGLGFPRHSPYVYNNQFSSLGEISNSCPAISSSPAGFNLDPSPNSSSLMGFNFPFSSGIQQEMGSTNNLASSIESLSSINQDLHWRLQQQRLAMLYAPGDENQHQNQQIQKPQPILFQNLETNNSKAAEATNGVVVVDNSRDQEHETGGNIATEWFFGNSYGPVTQTPANSTGNGGGNENVSSWNGMLAWTNLNQYSPLP